LCRVLGRALTLLVARGSDDAAAQLFDAAYGIGALGKRFGKLHGHPPGDKIGEAYPSRG